MFTSLRSLVLLCIATVTLGGGLVALVVINATSAPTPADMTSPASMAVATRALPPYWTIRAGDTFDTVAAQNHLTVAQLAALNPTQDPTTLVPGMRLRLRIHEARARAAPRAIPPFWVVRRGDTYSSIAARTGAAVGDIAQLNPKADPNLLVPGQRLKLAP